MIVNTSYGVIQTPVEANGSYSAVQTALAGAANMMPSALLGSGFGAIEINAYQANQAPGGVYPTVATMQNNLAQ